MNKAVVARVGTRIMQFIASFARCLVGKELAQAAGSLHTYSLLENYYEWYYFLCGCVLFLDRINLFGLHMLQTVIPEWAKSELASSPTLSLLWYT